MFCLFWIGLEPALVVITMLAVAAVFVVTIVNATVDGSTTAAVFVVSVAVATIVAAAVDKKRPLCL